MCMPNLVDFLGKTPRASPGSSEWDFHNSGMAHDIDLCFGYVVSSYALNVYSRLHVNCGMPNEDIGKRR